MRGVLDRIAKPRGQAGWIIAVISSALCEQDAAFQVTKRSTLYR